VKLPLQPLYFTLCVLFQHGSRLIHDRLYRVHGRTPLRTFVNPGVEALEDRTYLDAGVWTSLGPSPLYDPNGINGNSGNPALSGRISSLAFGFYKGQQALYVGAAGGGVFRTTDFTNWTPLTDFSGQAGAVKVDPNTGLGAGAIDVGSIAISGQNVYVGTGEANYSQTARYVRTDNAS
jgi:hypothetical protein